ncbi:nuclear transport factor 2 family protein [Sphaerisporangium fuscum]|uniref:nuclear transport factor 2 family protein n=1 Tax=Sphaerisporangium fuscum TaxID=2835868 RepID=UPI0035578EA9
MLRTRGGGPAGHHGRVGQQRPAARPPDLGPRPPAATSHPPDAEAVRGLAERYATAWENGDVETIVAMLTDDARYSMPPLPQWYEGRDAIRAFLVRGPLTGKWRFLPTSANGGPAFGTYLWDAGRDAYVAAGLDVIVLRDMEIAEVVSFLMPEIFAEFGLPAEIVE